MSVQIVKCLPFNQWLNLSHTAHFNARNSRQRVQGSSVESERGFYSQRRLALLLYHQAAAATRRRPPSKKKTAKMNGASKSGWARVTLVISSCFSVSNASWHASLQSAGNSLAWPPALTSLRALLCLRCTTVSTVSLNNGFAFAEQASMKLW